ncbi:MAG: hypothetical protein KatS3mg120_1484 [Erythrobacter sp.]|nr:MAG: hypothetical protein KatS3mg120_1484 [Erythrobacter sp.]
MHSRSLFSLAEHLERLSKDGDPLEVLAGTVEFERFRPLLTKGLGYSDGAKGGRPAFDPVAMFKVLVVQAQHNLSDARMEFMIRDRLSWMRFFGFDLGGAMPDENTIRHYRNRLTQSGTLEALMQAFEQQLREAGYLAMGGQIVDATLVPAPKQRNTEDEKAAIKAGKSARQIWRGKPNKAHQKDVDARWTVKIGGKVRHRPDGTPLPQIATPVFGYKSHISIDRRYGFIRKATVTSAADSDGRQLRRVIDTSNTAGDVWADSAYRSSKERGMAQGQHAQEPHSSPQAQGQADARAHGAGQCGKVSDPGTGRACLCAPEKPLWPVHPHHRHCPCSGQTHARQPRLQLRPPDLPRTARSHGIGAPEIRSSG